MVHLSLLSVRSFSLQFLQSFAREGKFPGEMKVNKLSSINTKEVAKAQGLTLRDLFYQSHREAAVQLLEPPTPDRNALASQAHLDQVVQ